MVGNTEAMRRRVMGGTRDLKSILGGARGGESGEEAGRGTSRGMGDKTSKRVPTERGGREDCTRRAEQVFFGVAKEAASWSGMT